MLASKHIKIKIGLSFGVFALLIVLASSCSMARIYSRLAEFKIDKGNYSAAESYFLKAVNRDSLHYKANLGLGIMYTEWMSRYEEAEPYLQRALHASRKDTSYDIIFALGKIYHYEGQYKKALAYYNRMIGVVDFEKESNFQNELQKRKDDCNYALEHLKDPEPANLVITNAGPSINSSMPEYVPLLHGNELYFTSKRKDDQHEKVSYHDGRYQEAIYISALSANRYTPVRIVHTKTAGLNRTNNGESVVSVSQDGKELLTFRKGHIYEMTFDQQTAKSNYIELIITKEGKKMNLSHAFITRDHKTIYFSSDMNGGIGGCDLYVTERKSDGTWGEAKNLGPDVNTTWDEDAPFLSPDGKTLYFSSNGHEGFGGYDIYKTYQNVKGWAEPQNLGRPFNSSAHDIFFVLDSTGNSGFFASGRFGGHGDMDIYRFVDLKYSKPIVTNVPGAVIEHTTRGESVAMKLALPLGYKPINYTWVVDGKYLDYKSDAIALTLNPNMRHLITSTVIATNDSCVDPLAIHLEKKLFPNGYNDLASKNNPNTSGNDGLVPAADLRKEGLNLQPLLFGYKNSHIDAATVESLKMLVKFMQSHPNLKVVIKGHCDGSSGEELVPAISLQRAEAVSQYLQESGIPVSRILRVTGVQATEPAVICDSKTPCDETLKRNNRRVTIYFSKS